MSKKPRSPATTAHAAADAFESVAGAASAAIDTMAVRLGDIVRWSPPDEMRRLDVHARLGDAVPAVVARVHPDGAVDLHPLPPLGSPTFRAELTWRVRRDDSGAPGTWRPRED